jgi:hypothetical protein
MYLQDEIKPGFHHTGEITEWDYTESNKYLYATTEKDQAIIQGFISACEKTWPVNRVLVRGNKITVGIEGNHPEINEVHALTVYLYTLNVHSDDQWEKNNNAFNGMTSEWVTQQTIRERIAARETINLPAWLSTKRLVFVPHTEMA